MILFRQWTVAALLLAAMVPATPPNLGAGGKPGGSVWPMFGGTPSRNMVNTVDKNVPVTWDVTDGKRKNIKWVAELGNRCYGGPIVADGKVFVGSTNSKDRKNDPKLPPRAVLIAFNEADGKLLWEIPHDFPDHEAFNMARGEGLCSTPVYETGRLYYVTPGCEVVCASSAGKIEWKYDMMKELDVIPFHLANCSPLIIGDHVLVLTSNGTDEEGKVTSPKAPSFIAVHKKTGKLVWQSNLPGDKVFEGQFSNPTQAIVNGKPQAIFAGGDSVIYSFDPERGTLIWKCDCAPNRPAKAKRRTIDNHFLSTPVVVGDRLYVGMGIVPDTGLSTKSSYVLCLDVTKKGDVSFKSYDAKAAINKDSALIWAFGGLHDPPNEKGREAKFSTTMSTPAVHEGLLYIPEEHGYLHCLDAANGKNYWTHDFKTGIWGSACYVDGKVYIGNDDGDVTIFVHGKERKYFNKGAVHIPKGDDDKKLNPGISVEEEVRSTPVVANGVLYIATKSKLYAIANGK